MIGLNLARTCPNLPKIPLDADRTLRPARFTSSVFTAGWSRAHRLPIAPTLPTPLRWPPSHSNSGLRTANRRSKRLDAEGRREGEPTLPSLRADLNGAIDEQSLCELSSRTSRRAFEHMCVAACDRLDMARELIASGCPELEPAAPSLAFALTDSARTL